MSVLAPRATWIAAIAAGVASVPGCTTNTLPADSAIRVECVKWWDAWLTQPQADVTARLPSESLETQYSVYLCGTQATHPPAKYLADVLASQGEPMASFLKQKLAAGPDDLTLSDIARVFENMQSQRSYDVKGDAALMALLQEKFGGMKDPYSRGQVEVALHRIANGK